MIVGQTQPYVYEGMGEWYSNEWNKDDKQIEIIYVPGDKDEAAFRDFYTKMPWLTIPFGDPRIDQLNKLWKIDSVPTMILVKNEGNEFKVIEEQGADLVFRSNHWAIQFLKKAYEPDAIKVVFTP